MTFGKILIAVNRDRVAKEAAYIGIELARQIKARVAFVHVVYIPAGYSVESGTPQSELLTQAKDDGKRLLAAFCERELPSLSAASFMRVGDPATEIVEAARTWPAELIVMGCHGYEGVAHALLGSVAESVMRHSQCPVLVVPPRERR